MSKQFQGEGVYILYSVTLACLVLTIREYMCTVSIAIHATSISKRR